MATRYCGLVTIKIRYVDSVAHSPNGHYRVQCTSPVNMPRRGFSCIVGAPRSLSHSVDSAEAYDSVAHAALSFCASHAEGLKGEGWGPTHTDAADLIGCAVQGWDPSAWGGQGWEIKRKEIHAVDSIEEARRAR